MTINIDVGAAVSELVEKSESEIETETAQRWLSRSIAAYVLYARALESGSSSEALKWCLRAYAYWHEALEHSALGDPSGETVNEIRAVAAKWKSQISTLYPKTAVESWPR